MTKCGKITAKIYKDKPCPACNHNIAVMFFKPSKQPLATIAWPKTMKEAVAMQKLPLEFVRCVECGHVYNQAFDYANVPYSDKPNLMYNQGAVWSEFINKTQANLVKFVHNKQPTIVEIGHGDGSFLTNFATHYLGGKFIGFDPHGALHKDKQLTLKAELFDPSTHIASLAPDLIICRHVLEHLLNPLAFLQEIALFCTANKKPIKAYFEVPCVDMMIKSSRTADLYYEHYSQFTTSSFSRMLERAGAKIKEIGHGYNGEVIYGFVEFGTVNKHQIKNAEVADKYCENTNIGHVAIREQLNEFVTSKQKVAVWGGTGKSASFINHYNLARQNFPLVVDSDPAKIGTYVPGTGQEIKFHDVLKNKKLDIIIIPPQWRAKDIVKQMRTSNIAASKVLIEHKGRLIDYHLDKHPYK